MKESIDRTVYEPSIMKGVFFMPSEKLWTRDYMFDIGVNFLVY